MVLGAQKWFTCSVVDLKKTSNRDFHASEEGNMNIDADAEWTYSNLQLLYRFREASCLSCPGGGTFVTGMPGIALMCHCRLTAFQVDYGKYDIVLIPAIQDGWPS